MPGSSLWLTPPTSHPLHEVLSRLIESTLPGLFLLPTTPGARRPPVFGPHLTLTSNIDPAVYGRDPQAWLDSLPFSSLSSSSSSRARGSPGSSSSGGERATSTVVFERVKSEDVFFRRCYVKCAFTAGVAGLAGVARAWGVHGDGKVEGGSGGKQEGEEEGRVVLGDKTERWLEEWKEAFGPHVSLMYGDAPIDDAKLKEVERAVVEAGVGLEGTGPDGLNGWEGGVVWLVSTEKSIPEWKPIATRTL